MNALGKKSREAIIRHAVENNDFSSKLPGCIRIEVDRATLLNRRFLDEGLFETRQRPAILVSGDDPHVFEALPLESLRTEAGELFDQIYAAIKDTDPTRQLLVLSSSPIYLKDESGKGSVAHHMIRMHADRAHVVLKGVPLTVPETSVEATTEEVVS